MDKKPVLGALRILIASGGMLVLLVLAMLSGMVLPVQAGLNAQLRTVLGGPVAAALVSFLVGTVGLILALVATGGGLPIVRAWHDSPWWYWIGGLLGAIYVLAAVLLAPRLGAATLIGAVVAGQMIASVALDHYGLAGFALHPVSALRLLGAGLIVLGVALVQR